MKKKEVLCVLLAGLCIFTSACGSVATLDKSDHSSDTKKPTNITIVTGNNGGTAYYIGASQSQILSEAIPGVSFTAEATDGSLTTNGPVVQNNKDCLGIFVLSAMQEGVSGTYSEMPDMVLDKLCLIMTGNATKLQFVTLEESGITSLDQLKGKRIATANPGTAVRIATLQVLTAMGYQESDFASVTAMTPSDMADAIKDGVIDVGVFNGGTPTAAVSDLNSLRDIVMLQVPLQILDKVIAEHPGYEKYTVTSKEYSDMKEDCLVLGIPLGLGCNIEMNDDLVYEITKILNESTDKLAAAHAEGINWNTENTLSFYNSGAIPFHPGAARYYEEIQGK